MLPRILAGIASAAALLYLGLYAWVIAQQQGSIAWWYVALILLAALSLAAAAVRNASRSALIVGLAASVIGLVVALLSIGILLGPTVIASAVALASARPSHPDVQTLRRRPRTDGFTRPKR